MPGSPGDERDLRLVEPATSAESIRPSSRCSAVLRPTMTGDNPERPRNTSSRYKVLKYHESLGRAARGLSPTAAGRGHYFSTLCGELSSAGRVGPAGARWFAAPRRLRRHASCAGRCDRLGSAR